VPDICALASIITKSLMYLGLLTSGGLVLTRFVFATEIAPAQHAIRKYAALFALLGLAAALASFALRGAALTGDASGLIDPEMLGMMWHTPVGTALLLRLIGLSLILIGLLLGGVGLGLAGFGALMALWSFAMIGHLSDGSGIWPKLVLMVHLLAIAFWIGILLPLQRFARTSGDTALAGRLGHRFGQIASVIIPGLILAGIVLGWILLGSWANLFTTGYGLALIAKLVGVALLLGLGAWNKLRLVPGLQSGKAQAAKHLARTLTLEWLVVISVLGTTAALTSLYAVPGAH
jgi:putative copper resistance protein D